MKNRYKIIKGKFLISMLAGSILLAFSACAKEEVEDTVPWTEEIIEEELATEEMQGEEPVSEEKPMQVQEKKLSKKEAVEKEKEEEEPEFIPEDLLVYLEDALLEANRAEILKELVSDQEIGEDEMEMYLESPDVAAVVDSWNEISGVMLGHIMVKVDGDNDGIEDLYGVASDGGSFGSSDTFFFKGKEDGTYELSFLSYTMSREFAFIEWDGKNYLLETTYDYDLKQVDGLCITCYRDGIAVEMVLLQEVVEDYKPSVIFAKRGYEGLAEQCKEEGKGGFREEDGYGWEMPMGSAETKLKEVPNDLQSAITFRTDKAYTADLDNDGIDEWYVKEIFYPSSMSSPMFLECYITHEAHPKKVSELEDYCELEYEGISLLLWVEHMEGTDNQIVCLMCYDGFSTNRLYGYFISGEKVSTVFEIEYEGNIGIQRKVIKEGL